MNPKLILTLIILCVALIVLYIWIGKERDHTADLTPPNVEFICLNPKCGVEESVKSEDATREMATSEARMTDSGDVLFLCGTCKQYSKRLKDEVPAPDQP